MKITVNKSTLISALQIITPITDRSSSKPILSNFLLSTMEEGDGKSVEFSATDYEIAIKGRFDAKTEEAGTICISAKKVLEVCREFLADEVRITADDQLWVTLEGGSSRLRLPSMDTGLYPQMDMADLDNSFRIDVAALKDAIDLTIFATQTDETRKNLMGVNLRIDEHQQSHWTATDGHRLAQVHKPVADGKLESPPEIIIPRRSLVEMRKILERTEGPVSLSFDERSMKLSTESITLTTRLIEGKFPNVDPIIPKDSDKTLEINRERMVNALKIVSLMSSEQIKPVKLSLNPGTLRLESERAEYGDALDEIPVEYDGEPLQIGFNARYLLDVLLVATHGDTVKLEMKGPLNPCLVSMPNDPSFLAVVMPLRIEW
ncbi:MAG: DNA polymerase III subunit beta [SAR324 cluster bacterium]|nr:DNA polymerase III subunit beta [SAR324 cluster bacterium]